ncbi:nuclear protein [Cryptococcus neoformans]|nr:nuclear protein [Cryptococcus neoformans var. grubii Th84]OXH01761.1 nuclear protein [Cryptococcus neoformans var. grubii]OXH23773.1 nuclear protein [Cryptococcus neoformans var. grubii]OXH43697.1 nuclear protein [Cryptococcus neoformans var. grubii]OXH44165.1 nuclear protein [Cryptococcus neoformans var. grubii]
MLGYFAALALALPALAQSASNGSASALDIEALQANFRQAELTPQLLETFQPEALLNVTFGGNAISTGDKLDQDAVSSSPTLAVSPASNATLESGQLYTIVMVDADIVGTDESTTEQTRHWLVNSASLSTEAASYAVNWTGSTSITDYAGPGPASGSGSHRYVIIVYAQPDTFSPPANLSQAGTPLSTMSLSSYVSESGLGDLITANYFQVENGEATVTVSSTTAVDSSTLAGYLSTTAASSASSAASGAASNSAAASATDSSATSASSAPASSDSSSGVLRSEMGFGMIVGVVGVVSAVLGAGMI